MPASRSKGCLKSNEHPELARREAHRPSRPSQQSRRHHREHDLGRGSRHRARLPDRARRSADRRRRGHRLPRFRARPPHRPDRPRGRAQALGPHGIDIAGAKGGDRIPSFKDFLAAIAGRTPLVIEIKSKFNGDMRLTKRVIEVLKDYQRPVRRQILRSGHRGPSARARAATSRAASSASWNTPPSPTASCRPSRSTGWRTCCTSRRRSRTSSPGA